MSLDPAAQANLPIEQALPVRPANDTLLWQLSDASYTDETSPFDEYSQHHPKRRRLDNNDLRERRSGGRDTQSWAQRRVDQRSYPVAVSAVVHSSVAFASTWSCVSENDSSLPGFNNHAFVPGKENSQFNDVETSTGSYSVLEDLGSVSPMTPQRPSSGAHRIQTPINYDYGVQVPSRNTANWGPVDSSVSLAGKLEPPPSLQPNVQNVDDDICYGMIANLDARFPSTALPNSSSYIPVGISVAGHPYLLRNHSVEGLLGPREAQILQTLSKDEQIDLELAISAQSERSTKHTVRGVVQRSLKTIIYGPASLSDEVGEFLQACNVYLQDPIGCHRNVRYRNPHRLSSLDDDGPMTFDFQSSHTQLQLTDVDDEHDLLEALNAPTNLPETESPLQLETPLLQHQKQALHFMICRELGWSLKDARKDVWTQENSGMSTVYRNNITGRAQAHPPPKFSGGILADPMGLGKSLTVISLIVNDVLASQRGGFGVLDNSASWSDAQTTMDATLLVVPLPLITMWEEQFQRHCKQGLLVVRRHHSTKRLNNILQLQRPNVVITTYQTIESEWRKGMNSEQSLIFSTRWKRLVLDEAHYVRDNSTNTFKAVSSINAVSRWAVTGTPLQNRLTDIAALLQLLRVYPYDDPACFNSDFIETWKSGQPTVALERLKLLLRYTLLRRSKSTVDLPSRSNKISLLRFSSSEHSVYEASRTKVVRALHNALPSHGAIASQTTYLNVLQQIHDLRLICNLGVHRQSTSTRKSNKTMIREGLEWNTATAQKTFESLTAVGEVSCAHCGLDVETDEAMETDSVNLRLGAPYGAHLSRCLKVICPSCVQQRRDFSNGAFGSICGHNPSCHLVPVSRSPSTNGSSGRSTPSNTAFEPPQEDLPTKIRALVTDLQSLSRDVKSVVFSYWASTLDLIERGLETNGIQYVRFDGKLSPEARHLVLEKFRRDASITVILMTITCASVGLDITAASRAYIMEPQWNPTVEEQALARIHRMGQTKDVTTVRFVMEGSFEQRVRDIQHKKTELAELLLSEKPYQAGNGIGRLQYLQSLLK
ncbi:hypothetical protein BU16DRAFT_563473 [Lophium mytilinum]|uniref:Uncharacterized protein n=1 Tax=Lophium mytilinum TaxID=390894 RepID=A0A6A6QMU0_9PEZI|nr:hypothetical protein BU16DRAFT_563473 [Lophium mytilinum]